MFREEFAPHPKVEECAEMADDGMSGRERMQEHSVSIVATGHTEFGRLDGQSLEDLIVAAGREAIEDAGISPADIDEVFLGHFNSGMVPDAFASSLIHQISPDLRFKPATRLEAWGERHRPTQSCRRCRRS